MKRLIIVFISLLFVGWGSVGHKIINENITKSFPYKLNFIKDWNDFLAAHASDADNRKGSDPAEYPKHFLDIDNYSTFIDYGYITQDFDSLVLKHGLKFVMDQGTLPWTILATYDSLVQSFKINDLTKAMYYAADLGHYLGDAHMPLHITANYNGQLTGQTGIHSRYESDMIGKHKSEITYSNDSSEYIYHKPDYIFNLIYDNNKYVDSVLKADKEAYAIAGSKSGDIYYNELWKRTSKFTTSLFKNASYSISNLIYSAYLDSQETLSADKEKTYPDNFVIYQNYPNPFNPVTNIRFRLAKESKVELCIYNTLGQKIETIINEKLSKGEYTKEFNGINLASGIYLYSLNIDGKKSTNKMILLK